jgi:hypothetical protein
LSGEHWAEGRKPFRYEHHRRVRDFDPLDGSYVVRDCDDLWIAIVPVEDWAQTIVACLNALDTGGEDGFDMAQNNLRMTGVDL